MESSLLLDFNKNSRGRKRYLSAWLSCGKGKHKMTNNAHRGELKEHSTPTMHWVEEGRLQKFKMCFSKKQTFQNSIKIKNAIYHQGDADVVNLS